MICSDLSLGVIYSMNRKERNDRDNIKNNSIICMHAHYESLTVILKYVFIQKTLYPCVIMGITIKNIIVI